MDIQWFPGHMAKTKKMMEENISLVDVVVEVVDARIPYSSKNPWLDALWSKKPRIMVLNKSDLADPAKNTLWMNWYKKQGYEVVLIDALHGKGANQIPEAARRACQEKLEREKQKGRLERAVRMMITGIPNVGKSTLINTLSGRAGAAKTGNKPGVTKDKQWIRLRGNVELLDTPGILWPKFEDPQIGLKIASIGSIKEENLDAWTISCALLKELTALYPKELCARFKLEEKDLENRPEDLLEIIGAKRGFKMSGGRIDWERTAKVILDEFRNAKIGRMTLEVPVDLNVPEESAEDTAHADETENSDAKDK